jgi:hypothetical protein
MGFRKRSTTSPEVASATNRVRTRRTKNIGSLSIWVVPVRRARV